MRSLLAVSLSCLAWLATAALADGPTDNRPENVRRVPKLGIEVSSDDRKALEDGLKGLGDSIEQLRQKKGREGRQPPAGRPDLPQGGA